MPFIVHMSTKYNILSKMNTKCSWQHYNCRDVQDNILQCNERFDRHFLDKYIDYLSNPIHQHYSYYVCINTVQNWARAFQHIAKSVKLTTKDLLLLLPYGNNSEILDIFKYIVDSNAEIPLEVFKASIQHNSTRTAILLSNYCAADTECLELASKLPNSIDGDTLFEKLLDQKIELSPIVIKNAIEYKSANCIESLFQLGVQPDITTLIAACKRRDPVIINKILQYRIIPTKECYTTAITFPNSSPRYHNPNDTQIATIIDLLVNAGYQLTYEDVINALNNGLYVNDLPRFNFTIDDRLLEICAERSYYPYNKLDLTPSLKCLEIECSKVNNLPLIKDLVKKGLTPNTTCLENACNHRANKTVLVYLIDKCNLKPTKKCLTNIAQHIGNASLTFLVENLDKENKTTTKDATPKDTDDTTPTKDEDSDEDKKIFFLDLPTCKTLPKSKKKKQEVNQKILDLFGIKKTVMLSYLDIRKHLINYINANELLNNSIIKPDKKLCKLLNLKFGGSVNFANIDKLVDQFYSIA
jgi:hypothetical protein